MSIEEVAARAGVGKTTIYRRWPSKGLLALDAFVDSFREEQPLPDTGTLRGDLLSALHAWVRAVTQTAMGPMLTGLIAEAQHDPELRGAWRDRVLEPLRQQHRVMLDRAIARGEIAASVDRDVVLDLFFGAAEHRLLLGHLPMTGEFIAEVVDVILAGLPRPGPERAAPALAERLDVRIWRVNPRDRGGPCWISYVAKGLLLHAVLKSSRSSKSGPKQRVCHDREGFLACSD